MTRRARSQHEKTQRITWAAVIALAALAVTGGAGYAIGAGTTATTTTWITDVADGEARIMASSDIQRLSPLLGTVYWAGERADTEIELTVTAATVTIRYIPTVSGADAQDEVLTVATYRDLAGYDALRDTGEGATVSEASSGALIAVPETNSNSTYFAFPGAAFQVEVYSPDPGESLQLVSDGEIIPISEMGTQ